MPKIQTSLKHFLSIIIDSPRLAAMALISLYQATLSPDHGLLKAKYPYGYCRHYPSCSEYSKLAIGRYGLLKGIWLGINRLAKCNPWSEPKIDPLPFK